MAKALKIEDVRAKSDDELKGLINDHAKELFNLRFQKANGSAENVSRARIIRRETARIKTILAERKSGKAPVAKAATAKPKAAKKTATKKAGE